MKVPLKLRLQLLAARACAWIVERGAEAGALRRLTQEVDGAIGTCDGREHRLAKLEAIRHAEAEALREQEGWKAEGGAVATPTPGAGTVARWTELEAERKKLILAYRAPGSPPPKLSWTFKLDTKGLRGELAEFQRQVKERLGARAAQAERERDAAREENRRLREENREAHRLGRALRAAREYVAASGAKPETLARLDALLAGAPAEVSGEDIDELAERAFWDFDEERKRTGAERDAFKHQARALLRRDVKPENIELRAAPPFVPPPAKEGAEPTEKLCASCGCSLKGKIDRTTLRGPVCYPSCPAEVAHG